MAPATKVNGVNIDQLFSMIDLLKEKPELAPAPPSYDLMNRKSS